MVLHLPQHHIFNYLLNIFLIMLQATLIGNLGANAEVVNADGNKFVKFRVAHTENWTEGDQKKTRTTWVDVTMNCPNGQVPAVVPYLVTGQSVYVRGTISLRVYSSQKDRCMKAGLTIRATSIELLGGKSDAVPRQLFSTDGQQMYDVTKYFNAAGKWPKEGTQLIDRHGSIYNVDKNGWISIPQPVQEANDEQAAENN